MEMKKKGVKIIGINFRDDEENFKEWINEHGNPFEYILRDDGTTSFTRDQLVVTGEMDGEDVTFIVCHWPSRWGGKKDIKR